MRAKSDAANGNGLLTVVGAFLIDKSEQAAGGGMPVSSAGIAGFCAANSEQRTDGLFRWYN